MKFIVGSARKGLVKVFGKNSRREWRRALALAVAALFLFYPTAPPSLAAPGPAKPASPSAPASSAQGGWALNSPRGKISHAIYLQFDHTHVTRDNSNVPSYLEQ